MIIDVSQSVEHAHPFANDFLRKDISNITDFFKKKSLKVLSNYALFQFITEKTSDRPADASEQDVDLLAKQKSERLTERLNELMEDIADMEDRAGDRMEADLEQSVILTNHNYLWQQYSIALIVMKFTEPFIIYSSN